MASCSGVPEVDVDGADGLSPKRARCEGVSGMSVSSSRFERYGIVGRRERRMLMRRRRRMALIMRLVETTEEGGFAEEMSVSSL